MTLSFDPVPSAVWQANTRLVLYLQAQCRTCHTEGLEMRSHSHCCLLGHDGVEKHRELAELLLSCLSPEHPESSRAMNVPQRVICTVTAFAVSGLG